MSALAWSHKVAELGRRQRFWREADGPERQALASELGILACDALEAEYVVTPISDGRFRVEGELRCRLVQPCGVTLDPVIQDMVEPIDVEFWPKARQLDDRTAGIDFDALEGDDPEPIEQGEIRIGRLIGEIVASALDPFPRSPDAELDHSEAGDDDDKSAGNPFAALARLKNSDE